MDKLKETLGIRDKFSLENAQHLCDELERIEETAPGGAVGQRKSKVLEASLQSIRTLTEVLVWMDRNKEEWFERVMERDVINTLERLVTNGLMPSAIKLQSLQSITVLLQNLSRTSSIYYVCSNNHINRMVAVEFNVHDDEFVSLYVSFLKTLALRCTPDTVQFFFDFQDSAFPLWDRAVRLLGSDDAMVRTAAKQIIVTIVQLQDSAVSTFVQRSIADVFLNVIHRLDEKLTKLAADIPSHAALEHFVRTAHTGTAHVAATGIGPHDSHSPSPSPPPSPLEPQQQQVPVVKARVLTLQLEDIEDEILYLNDVCRTPVASIGSQAAAVAQRLFLSRFQRIIMRETRAAESAFSSSPPAACITARLSAASDIPASVALAFLLYWIQVNTDAHVCAALVGFLIHPTEATPASSSPLAAPNFSSSVAALVLQSPRVDLHEAVTAIFEHAVVRRSIVPALSADAPPWLHFPASLSQFFYAETPYQHTGKVLVGGPSSTLPPPKEKFVQKAWVGGDGTRSPFSSAAAASPGTAPPAPREVLPSLIPHLFAALHTQLRYFHVTRLSCFSSTLSLLVQLLPVDTRAERRTACAEVWKTAFLELMKLIQRALLDGVKQYASAIQKVVCEQRDADGEVPLSCITFEDLQDTTSEEAPLPIRDPYAVMFLKLREAEQWLGADVPERQAILSAAHTVKDVYFFFPAYPILNEEKCHLVLNVWPPLNPLQHYHSQSQPLQDELANVYHGVQLSLMRAVALSQRSPATASECELNLYLMLLLTRHFFALRACAGHRRPSNEKAHCKADILRQTLRSMCPQLCPPHYFALSSATAVLSVRCELASEWHENANEASFAALGTPLCLVLPSALTGDGGRELLLLDVSGNMPTPIRSHELYSGECKRRVLLSLDLAFVGIAFHPKYSFKVIISYHLSGHALLLHAVVCDTATAKMVVLEVEKAANECRARGASLCFGIMNYRSALLD
ncbi:hypothetical protein ABL78_0188 [Leptomonas seymouri]|uniref:FPL domain-containing protein n=1 Tax=Leptomonas seymouri TaxID=5684 RepID=A0A0N1I2F5_LEPSE|nr:hypothetical protein ABL78_0188 [Leptomonas seymouri]|eukprot:KPI90752.1 hypothetical protein ABL78_0188 [Leptomonas seymouri]